MVQDSKVLIVSGMSGAGRSTVAHALEDLGWYVVDNLPPALIESLIKLLQPTMKKIAVIIDVRGGEFLIAFQNQLNS